jgi:hypothetical protein
MGGIGGTTAVSVVYSNFIKALPFLIQAQGDKARRQLLAKLAQVLSIAARKLEMLHQHGHDGDTDLPGCPAHFAGLKTDQRYPPARHFFSVEAGRGGRELLTKFYRCLSAR